MSYAKNLSDKEQGTLQMWPKKNKTSSGYNRSFYILVSIKFTNKKYDNQEITTNNF